MKKSLFAAVLSVVMTVLIIEVNIPVFAGQVSKKAPKQASQQELNLENAPLIEAPSAVLMESRRGQVLYRKNASKRLHISVANKMMTAVIAIEKNPDLSSKVTISKESAGAEGSALNLEIGEKYTVEDLLFAIMLSNANNAAMALAEFTGGGDVGKFITLMNDKAHELNLKDTQFTNPTGLYDESQYTTAYDLALLTRYAISIPAFSKIFANQARPWIEKDGSVKVITNQNDLFWSYEGVDGGKFGYNNKDQQTALTTATQEDQRLICAVLDAPGKTVFEDSIKLLDHGFGSFRTSILVPKGYPQKSIQVGDKPVNLISYNDISYTHPIGENYIKSLEFDILDQPAPPITKDRILGTARYILNDNTIIDVNLYPDVEIPLPDNFYTSALKKIKDNRDIFLLVTVLIVIEILILLYKLGKLIGKIIRRLFSRRSPPADSRQP